ncbi:MAG: DUF4445 domain-containing protein [Clostridia bacterium]|nr:DUF4445 domain-containing protein [Clostridia bacterium]
MPKLTLIQKYNRINITFNGTPLLRDVLVKSGIFVDSPCGGNGICGKCKVRVSGAVSEPNKTEINAGCRLACQTYLLGDVEAELLSQDAEFVNIETDTCNVQSNAEVLWKYGIAVDIGTTTVVLKLFDNSGECLSTVSALNPQRAFASDVIGRIDAALRGNNEILKKQITDCIDELLKYACTSANISLSDVDKRIITGNTAMLYLYTGRLPESISVAPFIADTLFGEFYDGAYLPPCMNAFVGADISCAILASQMCERDEISLLCDIGTNGEIALWKNGRLYVTSAAAGPAFEGGEISCGVGCVSGAIDRVTVDNGEIKATTIDNTKAVGLCGSGLISLVSAFLELGVIDESGYGENIPIINANGGNVQLTQDDIRAFQLAKAAISAAIEIMLKRTETDIKDIKTFYISGGFGNNLSVNDAVKIGLFPKELSKNVKFIGNAALSGAIKLLFDESNIEKIERIAHTSTHIALSGEDDFYKSFINDIDFPINW